MIMMLRKKMRSVSMHFRQRKRKSLLRKAFYRNVESGKHFLLPEQSEQILRKLHTQIAAAETPVQRKLYVMPLRIAVAALVLLVAGALWRYLPQGNNTTATAPVIAAKKDNILIQTNNTTREKILLLSDNSVVRLSPGSSMSYYASYDTGARNISLSGKAIFEVAKNPRRPFTVYAGDISTTALGTVFMVNTLEREKVHVKLFEGKVAIRSAGAITMQEVRLLAGEQFIIDKQSRKFTITSFKDSLVAGNKKVSTPDPNGDILEFNQEPLANVLARIGKRYHVQFVYRDDNDFKNMLVTGKFLPTDSLHVVLSMLGTINKLSFKEHNEKIEVTGRQ